MKRIDINILCNVLFDDGYVRNLFCRWRANALVTQGLLVEVASISMSVGRYRITNSGYTALRKAGYALVTEDH